ncbi:MAG TPA: cellulose biosynthesis cyclic di-GMP-binding regulatory protein BcsB, partial [Coleofasciculaceae cyanobacterium]
LLKAGYPFAAPQDLSTTAIAVPDAPSNDEILTLLQVSERLGRISQSDGIKLQAYTTSTLPETVRREANLIGIGNRERFPLAEALQTGGFELKDLYTRRKDGSQIQTLPDTAGVVRQVVSPWNPDRVVLALTAQTNAGLNKVQDLFKKDILFFQLKDDTVVVNTNQKNPSEYNLDDYSLSFFNKADRQASLEKGSLLSRSSRWLQENWFLIPTGTVASSLLLYGVAQLYLKRVNNSEGDS